jgi:hypothetical protein
MTSYISGRKMIRYIIITLILFSNSLVYAQQIDEQLLKLQEQNLASQVQNATVEKSKLIQQGDSLATLIQDLKKKPSLNIFQRQKLEDLLKSSQQFEQDIIEIDQKIYALDKEHQLVLKQLIQYYDGAIEQIVAIQKKKRFQFAQQKAQYQRLTALKTDRDKYSKKLKPNLINIQMEKEIRIDESDSYLKIKQKADLLKDQEDKIRKQLKSVEKKVADLENERKLRNRMNELISDTYLLDKPNETLLPLAQANVTREADQTFNTIKNSELQNMSLSDIINFLITTDVNRISHLDLDYYIQDLKQVKTLLNRSADSLSVAADQFYKAAEQKRKDIHN